MVVQKFFNRSSITQKFEAGKNLERERESQERESESEREREREREREQVCCIYVLKFVVLYS